MDSRPELIRRASAEGIGTFAPVVAGCGAIVTEAQHPGALGALGISFVFGLIVMAMVYAPDNAGLLQLLQARGEPGAPLAQTKAAEVHASAPGGP